MKTLQSTTECVWQELKVVELTEAEKQLLRSTAIEDISAKTALRERIKSESVGVANEADVAVASAKYNQIKPDLKPTDSYQLISADFIISGDEISGILNCRVNNEHVQIRL